VFALPSLSENFGNVVAEAMIRGLPVLVTEQVGAAELVQASGGGVVTRGSQQDFTAALDALLQSNERIAAAGTAGARYARERLTWERVARLFDELYNTISRSSGAGARKHQLVDAARS
jgi:glycosyltransferase involved in cell wall biosynthesis